MRLASRERNALAGQLVDVTEADTLEQVLVKAGLNYTVGLQELHSQVVTPDGVTRVDFPQLGVVRMDTLAPLGVVGKRYTPIQNADAFAPLQYLKDEGFIEEFEQAGCIEGGQRAFVVARLSRQISLTDEHHARLLFSTSHDGSGSYSVRALAERLHCRNQIPRLRKLGRSIMAIKHTQSAAIRVMQVRAQVLDEVQWFDEYTEKYEWLLNEPNHGNEEREFLDMVAPLPSKSSVTARQMTAAVKRRDDISRRIHSPANENIKGTLAALFQGAVEYSDYDARGNNSERILLGRDIEFKQRAWDAALYLV